MIKRKIFKRNAITKEFPILSTKKSNKKLNAYLKIEHEQTLNSNTNN